MTPGSTQNYTGPQPGSYADATHCSQQQQRVPPPVPPNPTVRFTEPTVQEKTKVIMDMKMKGKKNLLLNMSKAEKLQFGVIGDKSYIIPKGVQTKITNGQRLEE